MSPSLGPLDFHYRCPKDHYLRMEEVHWTVDRAFCPEHDIACEPYNRDIKPANVLKKDVDSGSAETSDSCFCSINCPVCWFWRWLEYFFGRD